MLSTHQVARTNNKYDFETPEHTRCSARWSSCRLIRDLLLHALFGYKMDTRPLDWEHVIAPVRCSVQNWVSWDLNAKRESVDLQIYVETRQTNWAGQDAECSCKLMLAICYVSLRLFYDHLYMKMFVGKLFSLIQRSVSLISNTRRILDQTQNMNLWKPLVGLSRTHD